MISTARGGLTLFFIISESMCAFYIIFFGDLTSDYLGVENILSIQAVILTYITLMALYFFHYKLWGVIESCTHYNTKIKDNVDLNIMFLFLTFLYLYYVLSTGAGVVDNEEAAELTFSQKIIFLPIILSKFNFLFFLYAASKGKKNSVFYFNIALFIVSEMIRGVSFTVLLFILLEYKKIISYFKVKYLFLIFPFFLAFVNLVYNVKYYVRLGDGYSYIDVYTTIIMLIGRLSILSNLSYLISHYNDIASYVDSMDYQGVLTEFLEKLTPMPSVFGINQKVLELGKIIFSFSVGSFNSANAISVLGFAILLPYQLLSIIIIMLLAFVIIFTIVPRFISSDNQSLVAYFFVLLTLYQGFWGLLANYLYALIIYSMFLILVQGFVKYIKFTSN